jgi:hypothetical protein
MAKNGEEKNNGEHEAESGARPDMPAEDRPDNREDLAGAANLDSEPEINTNADADVDVANQLQDDSALDAEHTPTTASETPLKTDIESGKKLESEPDKRLSDTKPGELAHALRQVFTTNEEKTWIRSTPNTGARLAPCAEIAPPKEQVLPPREAEAKSGYSNPFALFADVFYGVLIAPRPTLAILSDSSKFPPSLNNLFLTFVLVFGALALPAAIKLGASADQAEGLLKASLFILGNLADWAILSFILYYLSVAMRVERLTLGNAFIATGWAYLPFAFFAPVACFRGAMGHSFTIFACLPALWFLTLQWLAFQTSLRTSTLKLALVAMVVPPIFCLVYLFWIGLAVFSLLSQLLAHLT